MPRTSILTAEQRKANALASRRKYVSTARGKAKHATSCKTWYQKNRVAVLARKKAQYYIKQEAKAKAKAEAEAKAKAEA